VNREDFVALPLRLALGVIWDALGPQLASVSAPPIPRAPKYDGRLFKKGGFCWLSELDLNSLEWWQNKKRESAAGGGQYADRDAKDVSLYEKWIEWRRLFPSEVWSGTRGEDRATAAPPSREPRLHQWNGNGRSRSKPQPPPEDDGRGAEDDSFDL